MKNALAIFLATTIWLGAEVRAGEWDPAGYIGLDIRGFWNDPRFPEQESGIHPAIRIQPEFYWQSDDGRQRMTIVGFALHDYEDDERSNGDLREAFWGYSGREWDVNLGVRKVFWGVTESRHLVDVINQTDLVDDIDQESKLGQPMLDLSLQRDSGRYELFVMPRFRERTFPGEVGRFRPRFPVDTDSPIFESDEGVNHTDFAIRYSHYFGDVDLGGYIFDGTSREPGFVLAADGGSLLPVYEQMTQIGVDVQYTRDSWLWKLEAIHRDATSDRFVAAVAGFEFTFFGIQESATDVGLLLEYLRDERGPEAPPTPFDNDVFIGTRIAFNDASDTDVLTGVTYDTLTGETFFNLEAKRRIGNSIVVETRLRTFSGADPGDVLFPVERDDYIQLLVSRYF